MKPSTRRKLSAVAGPLAWLVVAVLWVVAAQQVIYWCYAASVLPRQFGG